MEWSGRSDACQILRGSAERWSNHSVVRSLVPGNDMACLSMRMRHRGGNAVLLPNTVGTECRSSWFVTSKRPLILSQLLETGPSFSRSGPIRTFTCVTLKSKYLAKIGNYGENTVWDVLGRREAPKKIDTVKRQPLQRMKKTRVPTRVFSVPPSKVGPLNIDIDIYSYAIVSCIFIGIY